MCTTANELWSKPTPVRDFLRSKVTAWSSASTRSACFFSKEKNFSPKSLLGLHLLQSLVLKWMIAQAQMCIFDHISKKGCMWLAEGVSVRSLHEAT